MANKRMFSLNVVDTDAFLDLPLSAQALYFHLNMRADDDGFVSNPNRIRQYVGAGVDDLKLLLAKRFILAFEDGVIVIKHWRMHNTIKSDRYTPTVYQEDLERLEVKDNKAYTERKFENLEPNWNQTGTKLEPQNRLGLDKNREEENRIDNTPADAVVYQSPTDVFDPKPIISAWNNLSGYGISPVSRLSTTSTRCKMLRARVKEYGEEAVIKAIESIAQSDFLTGKVSNFTITFDWFVKPNNFPKVLEGNYLNKKRPDGKGTTKPKFDMEAWMNE